MAHLTFDAGKPGAVVSNIAKAVCIWDYRTFLNGGAFGSLPEGEFKKRFPFIDYAVMMTFTGGAGRGEFYLEDENGRPYYDFAPAVESLCNVLRQGVKPVIVIGNVPYYMSKKQHSEYDSYEWGNRCAPDDWDVYHAYIRAFAEMLRDNFPMEEIRQWPFRVGTEPDNDHWWTPGEEGYWKLYDYTVDALQKGLGRENLTVFSGNLSRIELFDDFYRHCHSGVNLCTGEIGTQNDAMSISHYNDINPEGPCEYYDLRNCLYFVRGRMDKLCPGMVKSFNVGEGQFIMDGGKPAMRLAMAQDASSYSASWTAHMFDAMTEQGFDYFANWAWAADWFFTKEAFLPIPAWYPARFMQEMAGGKRIAAEGFALNKVGNTVGGFGSLKEDGTLRLMLYNHNLDRADSDETLTVTLQGLHGQYTCEAEQIDASTCFFKDWEAKSARIQRAARDVDIATVGSMYDSDIQSILKAEDKAFWRSMKARYAEQDQTVRYPLDVAEGTFTLTMPGHSVVMLTLTPNH